MVRLSFFYINLNDDGGTALPTPLNLNTGKAYRFIDFLLIFH